MLETVVTPSIHAISRHGARFMVVSIRLVEEPPLYSSKKLKNPCDVAELFQDFLKDCDREMFCILNLRTKNQVINVNVVCCIVDI